MQPFLRCPNPHGPAASVSSESTHGDELMARLELVAGNFGTGRADYINFEFLLPKKQKLPIEAVTSVEENGEYLERSYTGVLKGGVTGAIGIGSTAMVVGLFAAPLAVVGAIGLTAAAIGGGVGALGGSISKRMLIQIMASDGRGFIAICDQELPGEIRKAVSVVHAMRMRHLETVSAAATSAKWRSTAVWEKRPRVAAAVAPAAVLATPALAAPVTDQPVVDAKQDGDGMFSVVANKISSTADLASTTAVDTYNATTEVLEGAWSTVRSKLPWQTGGS